MLVRPNPDLGLSRSDYTFDPDHRPLIPGQRVEVQLSEGTMITSAIQPTLRLAEGAAKANHLVVEKKIRLLNAYVLSGLESVLTL